MFSYDALGNLTNINYPTSTDIAMKYDALNRLTNMVDAAGTCAYTYTTFGALATEDGPWENDTITYTYANQLRSRMSLAQPTAASWQTDYTYDSARRLSTLTSPAGAFSYQYPPSGGTIALASRLAQKISLPNTSYITNSYDSSGRMLATKMLKSDHSVLNSHTYGYNQGNQRTTITNGGGNYLNYGYDAIGQLKTASGYESSGIERAHEKFGYAYDRAGNLNYRTNDALVQSFTVNNLNQLSTGSRSGSNTVAGTTTGPATNVTLNNLPAIRYTNDNTFARTNVPVLDGDNTFTALAQDSYGRSSTDSITAYLPASPSFQYDLNGNLTNDGRRVFVYDDENQLISVSVAASFKSEFTYDGKHRRRIRKEYTWRNSTWVLSNEVCYVHSGNLVVQERDPFNVPTLSYTRGIDASATLEGAGGIRGLLALSEQSGLTPQHFFYHSDGSGNVTILINTQQVAVARYTYDPFGNNHLYGERVSEINRYRFSSKETDSSSRLIYYGFRFYDSSVQRWLNRDPISEAGGMHLYAFTLNSPINYADALGLRVLFLQYDPDGKTVDFTPTSSQLGNFNASMEKLRQAGDIGAAIYNWVNDEKNTLEVVHDPGVIPGSSIKIAYFDKNGNRIATPEVGDPRIRVDLGKATLCPSASEMKDEDERDRAKRYKAQIPPEGSLLLGHELGHAIIGLSDPWNVVYAENPMRKALGVPKRNAYQDTFIPAWYANQKRNVIANHSRSVNAFVQQWRIR